ncbi:PepSY domain-containing protein [Thalassoglobus sp. JC818]|uniref:PepSY domain-containing protein n=1 Tax=Thalassoglobus sp. JC818 TaxID=3232136 RepID=UPI00345B1D86
MQNPEQASFEEETTTQTNGNSRRPKRLSTRLMQLIRRIHLYSGLLLLPWVLLYGITGAMYNHQWLFPEVAMQPLSEEVIATTPMKEFPTPEGFAQQVVDTLQAATPQSEILLAENSRAEFTGDLLFEVFANGERHVVHIDPVTQESHLVTFPENPETPVPVIEDLQSFIKIDNDPHVSALNSVRPLLDEAGITSGNPKPFGWAKLNFLATVDGELARVTYVLKDGHVDVTHYNGDDGFTPRAFFMRLHTSHGQSPHWNGRSLWSLFVDTMAIAMVTWALSGVLMWWQIKRTRWIGAALLLISIATAAFMYISMQDFYATTKL